MADEQIVTELIVDARGAEQGTAQFTALMQVAQSAVDKTVAAQQRQAAAAAAAGTANADAAQKIEQTAQSYNRAQQQADAYTARLDPVFAATRSLGSESGKTQTAIDALTKLFMSGGVTADQYSERLAQLKGRQSELQQVSAQLASGAISISQAMQSMSTQAERAAAVLEEQAAAMQALISRGEDIVASLNPAIAAQQKFAEAADAVSAAMDAGVVSYGAGMDALQKLNDQTALAIVNATKQASVYDSLRASVDPLFAASKQYEAQLAAIDKALEINAINEKQAAQLRGLTTAAFAASNAPLQAAKKATDDLSESNGKAAATNRQLIIQATQFFSSIQQGIPFLTALVQQGHQAADVALSSGQGWGLFGTVLRAIVSPIGLVIAAGATLTIGLVAIGAAAESSQRQLIALQNSLRATRDDYSSLAVEVTAAAKAAAATSPIGTSDARTAGTTIAATPNFGGSQAQLEDLIKTANDLATVMRITVPAAAELLAKALQDPGAVAQELADKHFPGMSQALAYSIKLMADGGNVAGAFADDLSVIQKKTQGAADAGTPMQQSLRGLSDAFTKTGQDGRSLADAIGSALTQAVADGIDKITALVNTIRGMRDYLASITPQVDVNGNAVPGLGQVVGAGLKYAVPNTSLLPNLFSSGTPQLGNVSPTISATLVSAAQANNLDPELLARLQLYENSKPNADGSWSTSSAGNIGPMQVGPATFAGMLAQPTNYPTAVGLTDINNPAQNVQAGAAYFSHLLNKYQDVTLAVLAYHDGETKLDAVLTSGGSASPSQSAIDEARKVVSGYSGNGSSTSSGAVAASQVYGPPLTAASLADIASGNASQQALDAATNIVKSGNGLPAQKDANSAAQAALQSGISVLQSTLSTRDTFGPDQTDAQLARYQDRLEQLKGAATDLLTANQKTIRSLQDQAAAAGQAGPADQKVADTWVAMDQASLAATGHLASWADKSAAAAAIQQGLSKELAHTLDLQSQQTQLVENSLPAVEAGGQTLDDYQAKQKAVGDALAYTRKNGGDYNIVLAAMTANNEKAAAAARDVAAAQDVHTFQNQIDLTQTELGLIGATVDQRNREVAILQERQKLGLQVGQQADDEQQKALNAASAAADLQTVLQRNQQALSDVSSAFSSAFDQIGQAMTDSFLQGTGAAVNWKNVMISVEQTVLQKFLGLAILNPLLNSLFGQNNTTLGNVVSALGSGGSIGAAATGGTTGVGGSAAVSGTGGLLNLGSNVISIGKGLYSVFTNGIPSITGGAANTGFGLVDSALNYPVIAASVAPDVATDSALTALGAGVYGPATPAAVGIASGATTIGDIASLATPILGGVGAGFGIGSFIGGQLAGNSPARQENATIGAGGGALVGAGIGALAGPVGAAIGGLIGGIVGGSGGGLIGPPAPSSFSTAHASISDGNLLVGPLTLQGNPAGYSAYKDTKTDADTLNQFLNASGIKLTSLGPLTQFGGNTPGGFQDPSKFGNVASAFSNFRFNVNDTSTDFGSVLANQVDNKSFADFGQLQSVFTEVSTFVNQTVPALKAMVDTSVGIGSLATTIQNLHSQFDPAIAEAQKLGYAEADLTAARDKAIQAANDAVAAQVAQDQATIHGSYLSAVASVSGTPEDALAAALYNFDQQATQQRQALVTEYQGIFGDAYASATQYVQTSADLEQSLGEQRLAIQTQYNNQISQAAQQAAEQAAQLAQQAAQLAQQQLTAAQSAIDATTSTITSLDTYVRSLQTGSASPLSPLAQYDLAKKQFNAVSGAALAGDPNSISQLTSFADAFLSASRTVNGSGAAYAANVQLVETVLGKVGIAVNDALNTTNMTQIIGTQTSALLAAIAGLRSDVQEGTAVAKGLRADTRQNNNRPASLTG